jgi:hypothetical protein
MGGAFLADDEAHRGYFALRQLCEVGWLVERVLPTRGSAEIWQLLHRRLHAICFETLVWDGAAAVDCLNEVRRHVRVTLIEGGRALPAELARAAELDAVHV